MRRIILSSVACLALSYFVTPSPKRHDFRGKLFEHKMCILIFSVTFVSNILILRRIERNIINIHTSSCKVPLFISDFNKIRISSSDFRKILKYQIYKNSPSGSRVVPCRATDRHNKAYRSFANAPKNESLPHRNKLRLQYKHLLVNAV
jgi:hypothetical protein